MRGDGAIHPSNLAPIDGAVLDGPDEGRTERMSAAEWLCRHAHDGRAGTAIRRARARGGVGGACFRTVGEVVWNLCRVEAAGAG